MLPPVVRGGAPPWRLLFGVARAVLRAEIRQRFAELEHEKAGYAMRAWIAHDRELKAAGRAWTDADVSTFLEERLPRALEAADAAKEEIAE